MAIPFTTPNEITLHKKWRSASPPRKALVIRLHALGDVVITLPYLQALKNDLPNLELHFLTREEFADIPRNASMFSRVFSVNDRRNPKKLMAKSLAMLPQLLSNQYDIVLDLQRNSISRFLRRLLFPKSYSEFDRYSPLSAGERVRKTINLLGIDEIGPDLERIEFAIVDRIDDRWTATGYSRAQRYIVLNPAGSSTSKNWPVEHYARFAELWLARVDANAKFLIIGTERVLEKALYLKKEMGERLLNLTGMTTAADAYRMMSQSRLLLTEDSALMHMAWVSRVPLVALFGSTPSVWSRPLGERSILLDSSDLECGFCNESFCRYGDVHCLMRYSPETVLNAAADLFSRTENDFRSR